MSLSSDDSVRRRLSVADQLALLEQLRVWKESLPRVCLVASAQLTRLDLASKDLFVIPAGYEGHALIVHGETGSNAGTTAILDVGRSGAPATFVSGHNVLGPAGVGQKAPVARKLGVPSGAEATVTGRYVETGTPSTTGGPWTITLLYSKAGN